MAKRSRSHLHTACMMPVTSQKDSSRKHAGHDKKSHIRTKCHNIGQIIDIMSYFRNIQTGFFDVRQ